MINFSFSVVIPFSIPMCPFSHLKRNQSLKSSSLCSTTFLLIFLFFFYCVWKWQQKSWNISIKVVWNISNLYHKTITGWEFFLNKPTWFILRFPCHLLHHCHIEYFVPGSFLLPQKWTISWGALRDKNLFDNEAVSLILSIKSGKL